MNPSPANPEMPMTDVQRAGRLFNRGTLAWGVALSLLGCADQPTAVDRDFGRSTRLFQSEQSVHPHDIPPAYPPLVSEAVSGKAAIERYYKSFEAPPPPGNIFNIGVGTPMTAPAAR